MILTLAAAIVPPPVATPKPHVIVVHGTTLKDDYYWLREKENPEVIKYLEGENAHTTSWLGQHKKLEDKFYKEIISMINEDDSSPPYQDGSYMYYRQIKKGEQYVRRYRFPVGKPKQAKLFFDENAEAKGKAFFAVGAMAVSPDENSIAYTRDTVGFRQYELYTRDLRTGKDSTLIAKTVGSIAWAQNGKSILYTIEDKAKRQYRLMKHEVGTDPSNDSLILEEPDELFRIAVSESRDKSRVYVSIGSHTTSEELVAPSDLSAPFKKILPRKNNIEYSANYHGGQYYILINDKSDSFRIATLDEKKLGKRAELKKFMDPKAGAVFDDLIVFKNHMVITQKSKGLDDLLVHQFGKKGIKQIAFPEPAYSLGGAANAMTDTNKFRFSYSSPITPSSVIEVNLDTLKLETLKENTPKGYDKSLYACERVWANAKDGTKVPVTLTYRKSTFKPGENPSLLEGYGSYGAPSDAYFSSTSFPLIDRGFVMATLHIRGGGDLGKEWHNQGKMQKKMNSFTDFIDATNFLISKKYIASKNVFIEGGSAGGLLMGAVTNMAPQLYRGVLSHVPFVDVINTMFDETLPLTVGEYVEWGNPKKKKDFAYMLKYSPYDNLKKQDYPAMWIRTSLHDSQVMYWEPAKYVAKLRTLKTDANPLYLLTDMKSGHGGSSGRYDSLRERAQDYVFITETLAK